VWQEDRGFRLAAIRNRALAVATGEYIVMIDGDMLLHEKFVESHIAFARRGTYVQGGRVMVREKLTREILEGRAGPPSLFSRGIANRINAIHFPPLSRVFRGASGPIRRTRGANMAYWLADVRRVNGFNEDIEGWGYEDIEFAARLQNAGVARRNLKFAAVAYHLHHRSKPIDPHANREFFERVIRERRTRCLNGLDKYTDAGSIVSASAGSNG
jgi:GT2 family glycosyltransferase